MPLGVAAGVYLEEYAPKNWLTDVIEINVTNLAGVPSIIYGLLALGLFVSFGLGETILVAGMTLALLILPIVIVATREALRTVHGRSRGAYALGADQWQTVRMYISAGRDPRHPDRRDHRHVARDRRDRADDHDRRAHLHRLPAAGTSSAEFPFVNFGLYSPFTLRDPMFNWISRPQAVHINTWPQVWSSW